MLASSRCSTAGGVRGDVTRRSSLAERVLPVCPPRLGLAQAPVAAPRFPRTTGVVKERAES